MGLLTAPQHAIILTDEFSFSSKAIGVRLSRILFFILLFFNLYIVLFLDADFFALLKYLCTCALINHIFNLKCKQISRFVVCYIFQSVVLSLWNIFSFYGCLSAHTVACEKFDRIIENNIVWKFIKSVIKNFSKINEVCEDWNLLWEE